MKVWLKQFIRYGFVGIGSTTIHMLVALTLIHFVGFSLVFANVGAFFVALSFSYFGNAIWSFETVSGVKSLRRFLVVSGVTLALIVIISNWATSAGIPPYIGVCVIAVVIPLVSFFLQKIWVFSR